MLALDSDASFFTGSNMSWQHDMTLLPSCLAFYIVLATLKIHDNKKFRHEASGDIQHVKCQARQAATFADVKESTDEITYILSKGIQAMQLILSMFAFCMFCWVDKIVHHFYSCVRLQVTILLYLKQYTYHLHGEGRKQLNCDFGNPLCRSRPSSGALSYAETTPWVMNLEEEMPLECRSCGVQHRFFTSTTWSSFRAVKMIAAMNDGRHRGFQKLRYHGRRQRLKKIHYSCRRQKFRKINYLWNHKKKIILQKYKRKQFKVDGSKNGFLNMVITIKQFFLPLYVEVMKYESYVYLNLADLIQLFSIEIIYKKLVFETHKMPRQVPLDRGSTPPRESSRRRYPSRHRGNETRNERQSNKRMDGKNMLRKVSCDCRCTKRSSKYAFSSSRIARQQPPKTFWAFIKDSITDKVVKKAPRKPPRKKLIVMSDKPKPFRNVSVESSKIYDAPSLKDKTKHVFEKILFDSKGRETSRLSYHSNVKAEPDTGREKSIHVVHPPVRRERRNEQNRDSSQSDNISKISSSCPNISRERSKGKTLASEEQKDAKNSEKSPGTSDTKRSTETDYSNSTVESTEEAKDTNDVKLDGNEQTPGETEDKNGNKSEEIAQGGTSQNEPKSTVRENVLQPASAAMKECPLKECPCMASATMRNDTSISGTVHSGLHHHHVCRA